MSRLTAAERLRAEGQPIGEVYLGAGEIAARVAELGREIAAVYAVALPCWSHRSSRAPCSSPTSRARSTLDHELDVIELAPVQQRPTRAAVCGSSRTSTSRSRDATSARRGRRRHGATLAFLTRTLRRAGPGEPRRGDALDRPYRRLVDDIPLRYIGFTVPDELFAGYGLGLDERWRALPDLHVVAPSRAPPSGRRTAAEAVGYR